MAWPEVIFGDEVEQMQEAEISNMVRKAPHVNVWVVGAQVESPSAKHHAVGRHLVRMMRRRRSGDNGPSSYVTPPGRSCGCCVWNHRGQTPVISPWPLAELDQPCFCWLSWQIRGGEVRTVHRGQARYR